MKRKFYGLVMPLMAVFFFNSSAARATDLVKCTVDSECTENAFPSLNSACVVEYFCGTNGFCSFVPDVEACLNWEADVDCDDGNDCTADYYTPWRSTPCAHITWVKQGKVCDDGNDCTLETKCGAGVCGGGTTLPCDDGNACTDDVCDPETGCTAGATIDCDDGKECTTDSCNPATGICSSANSAFPTACGPANSGMVCNGTTGACITPECLKDSDCAGDNVSSCEGGIESLNVSVCQAGVCVLGAEPEYSFPCEFGCDGNECGAVDNDCNDDDPCTDDSIEVLIPGVHAQCKHVDDGVCCSANADCDDDNECTDDVCTTGTCSNAAMPEGEPCGLVAGSICDGQGFCAEPTEPEQPAGPALSGTLEVSSGNLIQGSLGLKTPGSDPAVPSGLWKDHDTSVSFADPECFLGNVKMNGKYALGGSSADPLVADPDGDFCGGITVDETVFLAGKSPTALGCIVECIDQGVGKPSTLNWLCGSCAVP